MAPTRIVGRRRERIRELDLIALLTLGAWVHAAGPLAQEDMVQPNLLRHFRRREYRMAAGRLRTAMEENPDGQALLAYAAINWSRTGFHADAIGLFRLCPGGDVYEQWGIGAHAEALRYTGEPEQAAALRQSQRVVIEDEGTEYQLLLELIEDHVRAGDLAAAEDAAWQALSIYPLASGAQAALSRVLSQAGREDEAGFYGWLAFRDPAYRSLGSALLELEARMEVGDFQGATELGDNARDAYPRSHTVTAARAELRRQQGDPLDALELLDRPLWSFNARPELVAVRARALCDLGDCEEGLALVQEGLAVSPADPDLRAALAYLEAASR